MSMIEKVAKAIYTSHRFRKDWDHPDTRRIWHEHSRHEAQAAIEALLKPTERMLQAARNAKSDFPNNANLTFEQQYRAAILAALEEDT